MLWPIALPPNIRFPDRQFDEFAQIYSEPFLTIRFTILLLDLNDVNYQI